MLFRGSHLNDPGNDRVSKIKVIPNLLVYYGKKFYKCNCLFWIFITCSVSAQESHTTLVKPKFRFFAEDTTSFKKHINFLIDARNSFVKNKPVNIYGVNLGYIFFQKLRIGIGIYKIDQNYFSRRTPEDMLLNSTQLKVKYITPNLTYAFFENRWLKFSLMPETGFGSVNYQRTNAKTHRTSGIKEWFIPVQFGFGGLFKINRWIGVQGSIGYRYVIFQSNEAVFKTMFNGMYFNYGLQLSLGKIFKDVIYCQKYYRQQKMLKKESHVDTLKLRMLQILD